MKASDCKVGDWLVLEDKTSQSMFPVTMCQVTSIDSENGIVRVTSKDGMFSAWEFRGTLMSNLNDGEPAKTLVPRSWEFNPKTKTHFVIDDYGNKFECSRQQSDVILDWWNKKNIDRLEKRMEELESPKLHIGDKFVLTSEMARRKSTSHYGGNVSRLVGTMVEVTAVGTHSDTGDFYQVGMPDGMAMFTIRSKDVDPYLPSHKAEKVEGLTQATNPAYSVTPKLEVGDVFIVTKKMLKRWKRTAKNIDKLLHTSVVVEGIKDGQYIATVMTNPITYHIEARFDDVDPYLPTGWHSYPDDAPSDMMIKGKKADEWTYASSGSGIATTTAPWPGGVGIDFKSMESHMEGGVKVHDDVDLKGVYLFSKPSFMTRLFNKVKRLTMSKTDKQLVDKGLMNLDGDPTEQGIELMQLVQWNEYKEKVAELNRQLIAEEPKKECDCECD